MSPSAGTLLVGLGSAHGDDQVGWFVIDLLAGWIQHRPEIVARRAIIPLDLLDWLDDVHTLHICDACASSGNRDTLHCLLWTSGRLINQSSAEQVVFEVIPRSGGGSHDFNLCDVLRLAETTRRLPATVFVWAIEGSNFEPGSEMTTLTRMTAQHAERAILKHLDMTTAE